MSLFENIKKSGHGGTAVKVAAAIVAVIAGGVLAYICKNGSEKGVVSEGSDYNNIPLPDDDDDENDDLDDDDDWDDDDDDDDDFDSIPRGCAACGGPWPECMSSCKLFDD